MTRTDRFVEQLEEYLEEYEGSTPLPERVRDSVRAALPHTKQMRARSGSMRYLSMTLGKTATFLAAAAAILVVAVGVWVATSANVANPGPSSLPAPSTAPSVAASPSLAAEACSATEARAMGTAPDGRGDVLEIDWCVARGGGQTEPMPFTMEGDSGWIDQHFGDVNALWLAPEDGGRIAFVLDPGQSVDAIVDDIVSRDGYTVVSEPAPTSIGGGDGLVLDVTLADGASSGAVEPLVVTSGQNWTLSRGTVTRVWVVERDGESLMIIAGGELAEDVAAVLHTLVWGN